MICKTLKTYVYTKMFSHSGLFCRHLCLSCPNSLYCLPKTFKPAPYKPWSGDKREKREGCEMYQDKAQKG